PASAPIRFEKGSESASAPGMVSAEELRNPLTKSGKKLLQHIEDLLRSGKREEAEQELKKAVEDRSAAPYAHSILGAEYLKSGEVPLAVGELRTAVRLIPGMPANHSNLAYALLASRQLSEAEREARQAVLLDGKSPRANLVLAMTLLAQGSRQQEALGYLT